MSYVNENIKILRKRMKLTQEEFAELIGINRKAIGSYEENRATPPLDKLTKICKLFGVTLDQLTNHRYAEDPQHVPLFVDSDFEEIPLVEEEIHIEDIPLVVEKKKPFSRTAGSTKIFDTVNVESKIKYVSHKYFDKYILDSEFESRLSDFPGFEIPFKNGNLRAFDVPVDSYCQDGVVIGEKIDNLDKIESDEYYLIVSSKKGVLLKKIFKTPAGHFQVKADVKGELSFVLESKDIKEVWKPVGFYSNTLPKPQSDLTALSAKLKSLKADIDDLL